MKKPKLLDQLIEKIRLKHYSYSTEKTYHYWNKEYILFHNKRHPKLANAVCEAKVSLKRYGQR